MSVESEARSAESGARSANLGADEASFSSALRAPRSALHSPLRAWLYLVWLSIQRQARARQMVLIALALLIFSATLVALNTAGGRWTMHRWRVAKGAPNFQQAVDQAQVASIVVGTAAPMGAGITEAVLLGAQRTMDESAFAVFSNWVVYSIFVGFLLPIWSLSFATEALGGERESRSLVWLLSRPMPRPAIYAAKFVALLPWVLGFNLGGFGVVCLAAGEPGRQAFALFWPAVVGATLAFSALFHLMSAIFRRPAVIAIVYSFFLETVLGAMPGYMKRISIGFYTRCLMFDAAQDQGLPPPERASIYLPVEPLTAWAVLLGVTAVLLMVGMMVFARSEYCEDV
jgi:ABC-2 type transport system permease protein